MKAFIIDSYNGPLHAAEVPTPTLGPRDVYVKVMAASVNPLDTLVRGGEFKQLLKYSMPLTLGHDVAGVVTDIGSEVTDFAIGDEIYARPRDLRIGTFAEYIAIDHADVALKPTTLSFEEAAAIPLVALAAWQMLVDTAHITPGQKVLVHAGAGGLGSTVIQLAKHLGAHVATTAGTSSLALVKSLGADLVIDYRTTDFADELSGYDLAIDAVGGDNLMKTLTVLAPGGLALGVTGPPDAGFATQLGAPAPFKLVLSLLSRKVRAAAKKRGVRYSFFFMRSNGEQLRELAALYDTGHLRPVIDSTFAFEQTVEALAYVEAGKTKAGKVVITHQ
ncbi:NADPH:quinone reductase-like Zn-dependent oxidoreductase [Williamsia limnetica]|uniref:NADPH:quinone reductase-like Zn-dependent oxidoreductase n=1 Tax=Williamsia limnetica TaxID=882452 RepID=A0A318RSX1_WILLI|nr:NADP-dependent oxidoreductase [Williamsia limnetica]PYE15490.1 NADPH:quinone reductase-like Zn-dependent oxidoreductase [Williamsia limnetica]